jgi:hypothetical protein
MAFKAIVKFGKNEFGVTNSKSEPQEITPEYLSRYVQCWCRLGSGFTYNRKANLAYFCSAAFVSLWPGLTASQIGHEAAKSDRWNAPVAPVAPVVVEVEDSEAHDALVEKILAQ